MNGYECVIHQGLAQSALKTSPVKRGKARAQRIEAVEAEASQEENGSSDDGKRDLANGLEELVLYRAEEVWAVRPEVDKSFPERKPTSTTTTTPKGAIEKPKADSEGNDEKETSPTSATPAFTESLLSYSLVASESNATETFSKIVAEYRQDLADTGYDRLSCQARADNGGPLGRRNVRFARATVASHTTT